VIEPQVLKRRVPGAGRIVIDHRGEEIAAEWVPDDAPVAGLLVGKVNEAVKQVEAGQVIEYLNRDALWAVEGFVLGRAVLEAIPEGDYLAAELIDAVAAAGFAWQVTLRPDQHGTDPL